LNLGKKAKIGNISFIGNKIFKEKKLIEILVSEESKFWKFLSKNVYLNERLINLDKSLLEKFYKDRGYYNVKIVDNYVELNNKSSAFNLIYNIDAGQKYFINDFSLTLPDDYIKEDFKNIFRDFEKNKGTIYSLRFIEKILDEIETISSTKSYDFIDVNVNESFIDTNKIDFNFVVSDTNKFYIENINISGNYITFEEVIRNQLIVDEGDALNNLLFKKSINEIRSLGFFKNVKTEISDGSDINLKNIDIILEEQPTGEISIAAGVGTTGFQTGGQISEKNFLGKGINLNTEIQFSEDSLKGQIFYSKPNFAYSDYTLTTSLRSVSNDFISLYGYETKEIGASVGTSYEQFKNIYFSPELDLKFEDLIAYNGASSNIKNKKENIQIYILIMD
jgi:outer membrane protein insertion porin family